MAILILGLIIFTGIHLLPSFVPLRNALIHRLGEKTYRGIFAAIALLGLVLIVMGKSRAPFVTVWNPPDWGRLVSLILMPLAFILFTAGYLPSNIKRFTRHPMLWGVVLWSVGHLAANGDRSSMLIFITIGLYSLLDMVSSNRRGAKLSGIRYSINKDLTVILIGLASFVTILFLHPALTGVRLVG